MAEGDLFKTVRLLEEKRECLLFSGWIRRQRSIREEPSCWGRQSFTAEDLLDALLTLASVLRWLTPIRTMEKCIYSRI
jgi:hypothetical protein